MELVNVSQLRPGLILATAIRNKGGAVLCPAGMQLTKVIIERIRNAGVESAVVEGTVGDGPKIEERLAALEARFTGIDDPILLQIKATIENRFHAMKME